MEELTLKNIKPLPKRNREKDLEWFCNCFGIIRERDKEKTGFKIFKILFDASRKGKSLTINEITQRVELSRTAVVHHLKYLEESGLVVERNREFELRVTSLHEVVEEIEKDLMRYIDSIKKIAKEIDEDFGLEFRAPPKKLLKS